MTNQKQIEWSDGIPDDVKKEVVNLLDYESRCNLKLCSRSDYELVNSTKFVASNIEIHETLSEFTNDKTIIRLDIDTFTVWFSGKDSVTRIDRGWNGEIIEKLSEIKQKNRYELIGELLDRFSYKGVIKAEKVKVDSFKLLPRLNWNFEFQSLVFCDVEHYQMWLQKLSPNLKRLQVAVDGVCQIKDEISKLKITESLNLYNCSDIQDGNLEKVTATDIKIFKANLSVNWVRTMLEHHLINGKRSDSFKITLKLMENVETFSPLKYIPEGLVVRRDQRGDTEYAEYAFYGKIYGGFTNIHGIQDRRRLSIIPYSSYFSIRCEVYESPEGPYEMDPILHSENEQLNYRRSSLY